MSSQLAIGQHLETYDPNWKTRFDAASKAFNDNQSQPFSSERMLESDRLLKEQHAAFHAQFPTAGAYRDWLFSKLEQQSSLQGNVLVIPDLGLNFGVKEVDGAYRKAHQDMEHQQLAHEQRDRIGQQEGFSHFTTVVPDNVERHHIRVLYQGGSPCQKDSCNMLVEFGERAAICFSPISSHGLTPTNAMDDLTREAYKRVAAPRGYTPEQVDFFNHVSSQVYSEWRVREALQRLDHEGGPQEASWRFGKGVGKVPVLVYKLQETSTQKVMDFTEPDKPAASQPQSVGLIRKVLALLR